ncbi:virulence factor TspB C-terminal domain-related protein [Aeromonas allosaccharophila]|uniref:virulence factor TspB C-terminal domain-related protein n=1 Tax=Aeromonas allosaccharophila TaxID=656 RepID=UPI002B488A0F|nr:virulence factor TspB C-terminal domain-related protein [Aeromonas allosaccharophila]
MVTKYKAAVFIIAAMFSSIASAAYTTMTIEGVKQANGVWTTAGVMDTQGFVRTTGAVSVLGKNTSTAVALAADVTAVRAASSIAMRAAGPIALAAAAYDVYSYLTTEQGYKACGDQFCYGTVTLKAPEGPGSCMLYPAYVVMPGYTASQCNKDNIAAFANYGHTATFSGWTSVKEFPAYYEYTGIYQSPSTGLTRALTFNAPKTERPIYTGTPVSDSQWASLSLPMPLLVSLLANLPSLKGFPIPFTSTGFTPYSEWYGEPYFKDGHWWRDRMDISPSGTKSSPTRVRADIGPVKFGDATNPNVVPDTGTAGGGAAQPKEKPTFCEANPMSIACAEMGELKDEKLEVEERPVDVSYTPWGSSTSQCPADKVIPLWDDQSITISYSPVCQFASLLRPLVIALAFVAAGFIVAGITRKGAES